MESNVLKAAPHSAGAVMLRDNAENLLVEIIIKETMYISTNLRGVYRTVGDETRNPSDKRVPPAI